MPYLVALLGVIGAAAYWYFRLRQTGEMLGELADAANDVKAAARRFGFKRKRDVHPAEALDDPRVAAVGIALAVARLDGSLTQPELDAARSEAVSRFDVSGRDAEEMVALARWIADKCGTTNNAIYRLSRRVRSLAGTDVLPDLLAMTRATASADGSSLGEAEADAIAQIERHMRH